MKPATISILSLLFSLNAFCQGNFLLNSRIGEQKVLVNSIEYTIDSVGLNIQTNYPSLDTIQFLARPNPKPIICNFHVDSSYTITFACCGSLDIIPSSQFENDSLQYWDYERDFSKIQSQLLDQPYLIINTTAEDKDSIYAWNADGSCTPVFNQINQTPWEMGVLPKCFYWNNINHIMFFKKDATYKTIENKDDDVESYLGIPGVSRLLVVSVRLFHKKTFMMTYDYENNGVSITEIKNASKH